MVKNSRVYRLLVDDSLLVDFASGPGRSGYEVYSGLG